MSASMYPGVAFPAQPAAGNPYAACPHPQQHQQQMGAASPHMYYGPQAGLHAPCMPAAQALPPGYPAQYPQPAGSHAAGAPAMQHAAPAHAVGGAAGAAGVISDARAVVVASRQYVAQQSMELIMHEEVSFSGDDFKITDATGRMVFKLDAKALSIKEKRTLLDWQGQPVLTMGKKLLSLRQTWVIYRGASLSSGQLLATVRPKLLTIKPVVNVFLNDGDKQPDFVLRGNFFPMAARKFEVMQVLPGGQERLIANVNKVSQFSSASSFLRNNLLDKQSYKLLIQPGVDMAFIVTLAMMVDELFHDQN